MGGPASGGPHFCFDGDTSNATGFTCPPLDVVPLPDSPSGKNSDRRREGVGPRQLVDALIGHAEQLGDLRGTDQCLFGHIMKLLAN